jgi:hypothetical protein
MPEYQQAVQFLLDWPVARELLLILGWANKEVEVMVTQRYWRMALCLAVSLTINEFGKAQTRKEADFGSIAGTWKGEGHILANWVSDNTLRVSLQITPDGSVSGSLGDARIKSGGLSRRQADGSYLMSLSLEGPLIRADGIARSTYSLTLRLKDNGLVGYGASNGNKSWPGASRDSRIHGAKVQVTRLVLERT